MSGLDARRPAVWAGLEATCTSVAGRDIDQVRLTGHHRRVRDIDRLARLGVTAVRYPALWEGVEPQAGQRDWSWTDIRLDRLRRLGIEPVVGLLHHGFGPGWARLDPDPATFTDFASRFARYAQAAARRYPWVRTWLPVNEPGTTARFAGLYGHWWPHTRHAGTFMRLLLGQVLAIRAASEAIRSVIPEARIVVNDDVGWTESVPALADQAAFDNERRWLSWDALLGRIDDRHPLAGWLAHTLGAEPVLASLRKTPATIDLVGIDHYLCSDRYLDDRVERYPPASHGGNGTSAYADVELARVGRGELGGPRRAINETWERLGLPIALTEVALAGEPDDQVAWWRHAWTAAIDTRADGVPVEAVTAWAAFGASGWNRMLAAEALDYEPGLFDVRTNRPTPRPVASAVRATALDSRCTATRAAVPPGIVGWWHRPDAVLYPVDSLELAEDAAA